LTLFFNKWGHLTGTIDRGGGELDIHRDGHPASQPHSHVAVAYTALTTSRG